MKRFLSLIVTLLLMSFSFANSHVGVISALNLEYHDHDTYEVWYDIDMKNPAFVIWDLTYEDAVESDAANNRKSWSFQKCGIAPNEKAYSKSGFDKGHMCPNNDRDWSLDSAKNTFRTCNICPQSPSLNRGVWKKYEKRGHDLAKKHMLVTIVCGPAYTSDDNFQLADGQRIPNAFFKVFVIDNKFEECYIFYQNNTVEKVDIKDVEKLTKLHFIID